MIRKIQLINFVLQKCSFAVFMWITWSTVITVSLDSFQCSVLAQSVFDVFRHYVWRTSAFNNQFLDSSLPSTEWCTIFFRHCTKYCTQVSIQTSNQQVNTLSAIRRVRCLFPRMDFFAPGTTFTVQKKKKRVRRSRFFYLVKMKKSFRHVEIKIHSFGEQQYILQL